MESAVKAADSPMKVACGVGERAPLWRKFLPGLQTKRFEYASKIEAMGQPLLVALFEAQEAGALEDGEAGEPGQGGHVDEQESGPG